MHKLIWALVVIALGGLVWVGPSHAQQGGQPLRPDVTNTGTISSGGEVDTWLYDGAGTALIRLTMTATSAELQPYLQVLDYSDAVIASTTGNPAQTEVRLPATGTYRILVSGAEDTTGDYELTLEVLSEPARQPLPTVVGTSTMMAPSPTPIGTHPPTFIPAGPQQGQQIELGQMVEGRLNSGRWDVWEFVGSMGQQVTIRLRSGDFDPYLELYGPSDDRIALFSDDDSGRGRNAALYAATLPEVGTYRIFARSYENKGAGAYRLSLEPDKGLAPSLESSQPIAYNQLIDGQLVDEETVYYFAGQAEDTISVLLTSRDFDAFVEIRDSNGILLEENDDDGRRGSKNSAIINYQLPADGTYFLVAAAYAFSSQGDFTLELLNAAPERTHEGEISVGQTVTARLLPEAKAEWHFWGEAGQVVSVAALAANPNEGFDLYLELVSPSGSLASDDDGGYQRNPALTDFRLRDYGLYTVRVSEYRATIGGYYHLALADGRVYFAPDGTPSVYLPFDVDNTASVIDALDDTEHRYQVWTVTVPAEELLTVSLQVGNGGSGILQDFFIQILGLDWEPLVESVTGELYTENMASTTDLLILVNYQGHDVQPYQLQLATALTPPITAEPRPIFGTLFVDKAVSGTLPVGERHLWQFTAPAAGTYRVTIVKANADDSYDPYLYILNAESQVMAEDDDSGGGYNPQITVELQADEVIQVQVASFADRTTGDYELTVEVTD